MAKTLSKIMKAVFPSYSEDDDSNQSVTFETGNGATGSGLVHWSDANKPSGALASGGTTERDTLKNHALNGDRFARYRTYQEMSKDSIISSGIEQLVGFALSVSNKTGEAFYLIAKDEKDTEYVEKLNRQVISKMNESMNSWIIPTAIFGTNYIRPYCVEKVGITSFESNFYTLPNNIREYERGGNLAGFTSENLKRRKNGEQVRLAEPWTLIPIKIPLWYPNLDQEPVNYSGDHYSLYDDIHSRNPIETQNYGTSLLHSAYEPYIKLMESIDSLLASRKNASRIDRLVSVSTDGLDVAAAASYVNMIGDQLKKDREEASRKAANLGVKPTIWTTVLPVMSGGAKGGVTVDTQQVSPDIQSIEDIMFHVKRLGGALGIDPSMLGFGDLLSGGLGDGGFFRTAIQAALRANLIRKAVHQSVMRALDIHLAFRDGKVWADGEEPYELKFNSLNTAIEQEESAAAEGRANYATLVATVLDTIQQGSLASSKTAQTMIYEDILQIDSETAQKILKELSKTPAEGEQQPGQGPQPPQKQPEQQNNDEQKPILESIQNEDELKGFITHTLYEELAKFSEQESN